MRRSPKKNPYEVLGIPHTASEDDVKKSFREKSKLLHPDTTTDDAHKKVLEEQFKDVSSAYEILSNKEKRAAYDNHSHDTPHMNGFGFNMDDIVNNIFGNRGNSNFHFNFSSGNSNVHFHNQIQQQLNIDVFTLIFGGIIDINLPSGETRRINIPPNTPTNSKLKLTVDSHTDLIIIINPIIPTLTPEQISKIKDVMQPEPTAKV